MVIGEKGTLYFNILENRIMLYSENGEFNIIHEENASDPNQSYIDMLQAFLNLDTKKIDTLASLNEARKVLEVIEAMRVSSKHNTVIRIN